MELKDVKYLLERFYQGETTLEEESALSGYFNSSNVPNELLADKETFGAMTQLSGESIPSPEFSKKLEAQIESGFSEPKTIWLNTKTRWLVGIAASVLLLVSIYITNTHNTENWKKDTYSDPDLAYQETLKVLNFVSSTMNRNTSNLGYITSIKKSMKPVNLQFLKRKENENKKYSAINTDNDMFFDYIATKWPGIAGR